MQSSSAFSGQTAYWLLSIHYFQGWGFIIFYKHQDQNMDQDIAYTNKAQVRSSIHFVDYLRNSSVYYFFSFFFPSGHIHPRAYYIEMFAGNVNMVKTWRPLLQWGYRANELSAGVLCSESKREDISYSPSSIPFLFLLSQEATKQLKSYLKLGYKNNSSFD